jgi:hypothetical protein
MNAQYRAADLAECHEISGRALGPDPAEERGPCRPTLEIPVVFHVDTC